MDDRNQWQGEGRLTRDPVVRLLDSGTELATFVIACKRSWSVGGQIKEATDYIPVTAWRRQAEIARDELREGSRVLVAGRIQSSNWEDAKGKHYKVEINATSLEPLELRSGSTRVAQ